MRILFPVLALAVMASFSAQAQKIEMNLDGQLRPTNDAPQFYSINEFKDSVWLLQIYYIKEKSLAMEGTFFEKGISQPHGLLTMYHRNKMVSFSGNFLYGKKEGTSVEYTEEGVLIDSSHFSDGERVGVHMKWHPNGMPSDSVTYREDGSATHLSWNKDGYLISAGITDEKKKKTGTWKYFDSDGKQTATEIFESGMLKEVTCFDSEGKKMPKEKCFDKRAHFAEGIDEWVYKAQKNFLADMPRMKSLEAGSYWFTLQFEVDVNGELTNFTYKSDFGENLEEYVVKAIKKTGNWVPAVRHGRVVPVKLFSAIFITKTRSNQVTIRIESPVDINGMSIFRFAL